VKTGTPQTGAKVRGCFGDDHEAIAADVGAARALAPAGKTNGIALDVLGAVAAERQGGGGGHDFDRERGRLGLVSEPARVVE
jgi:hypothetical protein